MTSFLLPLLLFLIHTAAAADVHSPRLVQRIAFGSCNKADAEQPLWPHVAFYEPDVLLLLGDNVYNDERVFFGVFRANPLPAMAAMYARQKENPGFARVRASVPAVIGTWDGRCPSSPPPFTLALLVLQLTSRCGCGWDRPRLWTE